MKERDALAGYRTIFRHCRNPDRAFDTAEALRKAQGGDQQAFDSLIHEYQGMVIKNAITLNPDGKHLDDLIQEGNVGLTLAIQKADASKPEYFSGFAKCLVKRTTIAALGVTFRTVQIGTKTVRRIREIQSARARLAQTLERWPTPIEVAAEIGVPVDIIFKYDDLSRPVLSLNHRKSSRTRSLGERLSEVFGHEPDLEAKELESAVHLVEVSLRAMDPKLTDILLRSYGENPQSTEEVARVYKVKATAVAHLRQKGLKTLALRLKNAGLDFTLPAENSPRLCRNRRHVMTAGNILIQSQGKRKSAKTCRACFRESQQRYKQKNKSAHSHAKDS